MKTVFASPKDNLQQLFDCLQPNTTVILKEGIYHQKAVLSVPNITLQGEGPNTILTFDDFAKKLDDNGKEYTTFKTFTLAIVADGVTVNNLVVENSAGNPGELGQEVALSVCGSNFTAQNCTFVSTQDTLFCGPLPDDLVVRYNGFLPNCLRYREGQTFQKFVNCKIVGTVDFIFGCANALFENCEIVSTNDNRAVGYVAAPAHHLANTCGFVFHNCNLVSDNAATTYLARPWRDFGKVTFLNCTYDKHIAEVGFVNWQGTERTLTARFAEFAKTPFARAEWSKTLTKNQAETFLQQILPFFDF